MATAAVPRHGLGTQFAVLGYVPSPMFDRAVHDGSRLSYNVYHTTFVFGILCALVRMGRDPDERMAAGLSRSGGELPREWDGRRAGIAEVAEQIGRTFHAWRELAGGAPNAAEERKPLRQVLDVDLLRAHELMSLFAMARVAGVSSIHDSGWRLPRRRALLSGRELPADPLIATA
ncbi:hypothetical protein [Nocardia acidivorans]|uniref:hypothetical protein n=1 Tax=Nocardia acidivorans TaxID=404580 RepID=UPI0008317E39|nr:hypothetical protein [Nocardia acidivorans]